MIYVLIRYLRVSTATLIPRAPAAKTVTIYLLLIPVLSVSWLSQAARFVTLPVCVYPVSTACTSMPISAINVSTHYQTVYIVQVFLPVYNVTLAHT